MTLPDSSAEPSPPGASATDAKQRLVAFTLDFTRRSLEAKSLDELTYLLTNDVRAVIEFDRSILTMHLGGSSHFVAAGNQPLIEKKSTFFEELERLAPGLTLLKKPLLLSPRTSITEISDDLLPSALKEALSTYIEFAGCKGVFCVPLIYDGQAVAHLLFEFMDQQLPDQARIVTFLQMCPFFASALVQKWLFHKRPELSKLTESASWRDLPLVRNVLPHLKILAMVAVAIIFLLFILPFPYTVGGEAEIIARDRHLAFCRIDGLIDRIFVTEGSRVKEGEIIARLDPTELDHKIRICRKQIELLTNEMVLLRKAAGQDMANLAESHLVAIKRKSAVEELRYLLWQRGFVDVKAPASGLVVTRHIETLVGKKFKAGEPFAEIVAPGALWAEIYVPEDRVSYVGVGQEARMYFNSDPVKGYPLKVEEISPRSEAMPRLGNIYRVRAGFQGAHPTVKVGMKGVGKITTGSSSLWQTVKRRLYAKWNHFTLIFW